MFKPKLVIDAKTAVIINEYIVNIINMFGERYFKEKHDIGLKDILSSARIKSADELNRVINLAKSQLDIQQAIPVFYIDSNSSHMNLIRNPGLGKFTDNSPGGLYLNDNNEVAIGIKEDLLLDSIKFVAVFVHELCHYKLLYELKMEECNEEFTDLLPVFFGFGFFSNYSCVTYLKYQNATKYGWSISQSGYLNEDIYGYAMAIRDIWMNLRENKNSEYLKTNTKYSYKKTRKYYANSDENDIISRISLTNL